MKTIIGVDFSGAKGDRNTWVAQGELTSDREMEFYGVRMMRRGELADLLSGVSAPAVAAIDFPFGVPARFAEFLNEGMGIESMDEVWRMIADMSLEDFISARDAFVGCFGEAKREGDKAYFSESFSPLHKVNPNMLPMTYYGVKMLHRLCRRDTARWVVPPLHSWECESDETVTLLETMPGAFLRSIGTIYKGYKKPKSAERRDRRRRIIMDAIESSSGVALSNLSLVREGCIDNDDCLDAVVAAVAAASWAQSAASFRHPSESELGAAKLEGWIYAPLSDAGTADE